jgi:hypothetical protein
MKNNLFEKNIQSKLANTEIAPSDGLFEKTMQKRAMAQKKGVLPFYYKTIAVLLIMVSSIGAIWYLYQPNPTDNTENIVMKGILENQSQLVLDDGEKVDDTSSNSATPKMVIETMQSSNDLVNKSNIKVLKSKENVNTRSKSKTFIAVNSVQTNQNKNVFFEDNGDDIFERYFNANSNNKPSLYKETHKGNSHLYVYNSLDESLVDAVFVNYMKMAILKRLVNRYPKGESNQINNHTEFKRNTKTKKPLFIDLFGIVGFSKSMPHNGLMADVLNSGSEVVQNDAYGFRAVVPLKNKWSVFSGLNMLNQNSKYQFDVKSDIHSKEVKLVTRYLNDPILGVLPFVVSDTVDVINSVTNKYKLRNNYKIIQIPIGVSYQMALNKKIEVGIKLSSMFNVNVQSQIMILDDLKVKTINNTNKSFSLSHALGVQLAYGLSPKWKVFAEPSLQFMSLNSKKLGNNIDERFLNKQLAFGLRYSLF